MFQQHRLLGRGQCGGLDAFRLNQLAVIARAKHEIADLVRQDGLLPLLGVEGVDQGEPLVVYPPAAGSSVRSACTSPGCAAGRLGVITLAARATVTLIAR